MQFESGKGGMSVRIDGSQFRRYFEDRQNFDSFIRRSLERTGEAGEGLMIKYAPKDRGGGGGLISRISAKVSRGEMEVKPRMDSVYPKVMITGTKPFIPPFGPIKSWARRKGLPAGPIWMGIRKEGIKSARESDERVNYQERTKEDLEKRTPKIFEDELRDWVK